MAPHVWTCLQGKPNVLYSYRWHARVASGSHAARYMFYQACVLAWLAGLWVCRETCTALPNLLRLLNPPTLCLFSRATSSALDIPLCWLRSSSLASSRLSPCTTLRLPGEHALCLPLVRAWAVNQPPAAGLRSLVGVRCPCMGSCLSRRMSRRLRHNCHVMILAVWRVLCACSPCL